MKFYIFSVLIFFATNTLAQERNRQGGEGSELFKVTGQVLDSQTGEPLEYVTAALISDSDSTITGGAVTGIDGKFEITGRPGRFTLRVEFLSYKARNISGIQLNREQMTRDVGTIRMEPNTEVLDEVIVEGERSSMTMTLDKRVFNVGKDLTNAGRSAADLLDNIPSVTVDVEGNVSLRGSNNVRILVDGKPSGLIGINTADGLRQLQSNMIESVEVVTNPSARYDAEGSAGIINIILKKERRDGINGSFNVIAGVPQNIGGSLNLNYRKKWTNLFASYGLEYDKSPGGGSSFQTFFPGDTLYYTIRDNDRERGGWSNNLRFGSDFFLNDKNTITVAAIYRISDEDNDYYLNYRDLDGDKNLLYITDRYDNELEIDKNSEYSVNYSRTFKKQGQKLSAEIQYRDNEETEESSINEVTYDVGEDEEQPELFQRSLNDEFDRGWLMQADYEQPFGKDGKLELGIRNSLRRIGNDYLVEELNNESGEWENLEGFSNNFIYDENIYASYAIFGNKANKFSYQLGLRMEITDIRTELEQTREINDKNYTDLFPSVHLTYTLKEEKFLQGSYSRRIQRPWFRSLNPFSSFSDARNIRTGNSDLNPEYSDSYELGVLQNWEKSSFYYALYYRYSTGVVNFITTVDDGITYTRPENVGTSNDVGLEVTYSTEFNSWLRVNGTANFYHSVMEAFANGEDLGTETTTFFTRVMSQMKIGKEWDLQTTLSYRAPQNVPQGRRQSYFVVDLGLSRDVLKGNGTLTLSVRDLFNTRKYRYETITPTYTSEAEFQWRSRSAIVSFTYRLNQNKERRRGERGGDGDFDGGGDMDF